MMILYSIKDDVAGTFMTISPAQNVGIIRRQLATAVNTPDNKNLYHTNPEDFSLYQVGTFDEVTGKTTSEQQFEFRLSDLVKKDAQ